MNQSKQDTHWTYRLFVEHAELYLPFLEQAKERAPMETDVLAGLFEKVDVSHGGKVLDVACGIGRHSVLLAQRGYRVTGVDISPLYVQKARECATAASVDASFAVGNALEIESLMKERAPFDAFINMFTSHSYYGKEADVDMFRQLHRLAAPDATLVVLTANRDWIIRNFARESVEKAGAMRILQRRSLNLETSDIYNTWEFYEGHEADLNLKLRLDMKHRLYSLHELIAMLEDAGWRYQRSLAPQPGEDFQMGPVTFDSNAMWLVMKAG